MVRLGLAGRQVSVGVSGEESWLRIPGKHASDLNLGVYLQCSKGPRAAPRGLSRRGFPSALQSTHWQEKGHSQGGREGVVVSMGP